MLLLIDDRAGSKELAHYFSPDEAVLTQLEFGDVAFTGNGPDGEIMVGVEYKKIHDVLDCIRTGRFTGHQAPGMMEHYDHCWLLIEGQFGLYEKGGKIKMASHGKFPTRDDLGFMYSSLDSWLTSISVGAGFGIKMTPDIPTSVSCIRNLYNWYQKPWEDHTSLTAQNNTKLMASGARVELVEIQPSDKEYPSHLMKRCLVQIHGVSWKKAVAISGIFGSLEELMAASVKDIMAAPTIGKVMAERIYNGLHGNSTGSTDGAQQDSDSPMVDTKANNG